MQASQSLAVRPNEVNQPAGEILENFCIRLGERLRAPRYPAVLSPDLIAHYLRSEFNLYPPVITHLGRLLDEMEIDWSSEEAIVGDGPACYLYNYQLGKWQILVRSDAGSMESIHVLHELYELLWWRCFHLIPEWNDWASASNMKHPHDTAEEFAQDIVLCRGSFGADAKEHGYNPIALAGKYQTAAGVCFQAFLRLPFYVPYVQIRLDLAAKPDQPVMSFEDVPVTRVKIHNRGTKFRNSLNPKKWPAMFHLYNHLPAKGEFVPVEDWICQAAKRGYTAAQTTNTLFGIQLPKPVFAVLRPRYSKPFIQAVPLSKKELLMDGMVTAILNDEKS